MCGCASSAFFAKREQRRNDLVMEQTGLDWTGLRCSGGEDRFQNHSSKTKEENKRQEEGKRIENRGRREGGEVGRR